MKKPALAKRERQVLLLVGGLSLVIGYVYVAYILGPLSRETAELGAKVRSARDRVKALEVVMANEPALRAQYGQWDEKVASLRALLPPRADESVVLERLSNLARQTQVKIQAIFPQRAADDKAGGGRSGAGKGPSPLAQPAVYEDVLIQIDASAGYHQLGTFISLVEAEAYPMRVSSLRIAANPKDSKRHTVKVLIRAYFSTSPTSGTS
jgi:Tfp pilus assembly protein PilO